MSSGQILIPAGELLGWYRTAQRDLPWRAPDVTAWQILVSEFMLQQTPVSRVEPIWRDWIARWPTRPRPPQPAPRTCCAPGANWVIRAAPSVYTNAPKSSPPSTTTKCPRRRDPADTAGHRRLHRTGRRLFRLPAGRSSGRYQRAPGGRARGAWRGRHPARTRDLDDVAALLPKDGTAHVFSAALMELGAIVCTARTPKCGICPLTTCAWRSAGHPEMSTPTRPVQKYAGTDRQVRGRLLDVLRGSVSPVTRAQLDVAWLTDPRSETRLWTHCWSTAWSSRPPTTGTPWPARVSARTDRPFT